MVKKLVLEDIRPEKLAKCSKYKSFFDCVVNKGRKFSIGDSIKVDNKDGATNYIKYLPGVQHKVDVYYDLIIKDFKAYEIPLSISNMPYMRSLGIDKNTNWDSSTLKLYKCHDEDSKEAACIRVRGTTTHTLEKDIMEVPPGSCFVATPYINVLDNEVWLTNCTASAKVIDYHGNNNAPFYDITGSFDGYLFFNAHYQIDNC